MKTIISNDGLLEFLTVVSEGNFSKAASHLNVSKSYISKQVAKLEESSQKRLLNRTTRIVSPTDEGQALYEKTRPLINDLNQIMFELSQSSPEARGNLKISVAGTFGEKIIGPILIEFLKLYPKINAQLIFNNSIVDLIDENYDFAIRYGDLPDSSMMAKKIALRKEFYCASPDYLKKYGIPLEPKDLSNHNCLIGQHQIWTFTKGNKKSHIKVKGNFSSNNPKTIRSAVMNDLGISYLPGIYVFQDILSKRLIPLFEDYNDKSTDIWFIYPSKKFLPKKVTLFSHFLSENLFKNYRDHIF